MYQQINITNQESIFFDYKILNKKECKKYFNSKSMIKKGYQPIQITFTNNSKKHIAISPDNFSFRCANALDVANSLHRNGVARGIGFGLGTLWFFPLIFPAFIQGLGATEYNEQMDIDFSNKSFKNQVVAPYSIVDGIIFASQDDFNTNFTLIVKDIDSKDSLILSSKKPLMLL